MVKISNGLLKSVVASLFITAAVAANADHIDFQDLAPSTFQAIPNGYHGLNWTNLNVANLAWLDGIYTKSGYDTEKPTTNVTYTPIFGGPFDPGSFTLSSATAFNLLDAKAGAAWMDGMNIEVQGFDGATLVYDKNFTAKTEGLTYLGLGFHGITSAVFTSSGGTHNDKYNWYGEQAHYAFIDTSVGAAATPAPAAALSFVLAALARRRRRA